MSIVFHEKTGIFHLSNRYLSYLVSVMPSGHLGQLCFGAALTDREDFSHLCERGHRDMAPVLFDGDTTFSLEHLKQEYPSFGKGDMRYPAFEIRQEIGSTVSDFRYAGYQIRKGKKPLPELPAVYTEEESEAETLEIVLRDETMDAELLLSYSISRDFPVIARSVSFHNTGSQALILTRAMSLSLDLPDANYEMLQLTGASLRERYPQRNRLREGVQSIHSMRGHSSHQFNPFLALLRPETTERTGEVIGISLVYSGNFLGQVEVDTMDTARVMIGIHPQNFAWPLQEGESFQTPEAVMVYTKNGLNGMSHVFHTLYRTRLARGIWRDKERPILINNWEATYMTFNEEKILSIAKKAKELGIEMMVLDDGWFGHRDDDTTSLGDWYPNLEKLPSGIRGLSEKITEMGMLFGLWIEPEMVSRDSDLFRAHPDWVLGNVQGHLCQGRHQYVLDFSREEVVEYIGDQIEKLLKDSKISYVKWDMNRSISDLFSNGRSAADQGCVYHRQILGIYRLYERLTGRYPQILFESCASGGGRFDPGMLYYAPQAWTSDDTDACERVKIQYGSSYVYPLSSISSHVSAVPNHQTFRSVPLETRAAVACFGAFGYELDLNLLSKEEQEQVKKQVAFVKKYRSLIQNGTFYRLTSPFEGNKTDASWMVVSKDRSLAIFAYYRLWQPVNSGYNRIRLEGLDPEACYVISDRDYSCYGDELMEAGFLLSDYANGVRTSPVPQGDGQARIVLLRRSKKCDARF